MPYTSIGVSDPQFFMSGGAPKVGHGGLPSRFSVYAGNSKSQGGSAVRRAHLHKLLQLHCQSPLGDRQHRVKRYTRRICGR